MVPPSPHSLAIRLKDLWSNACSECHPANANEFHGHFSGTAVVPLELWLKTEEDILVMSPPTPTPPPPART